MEENPKDITEFIKRMAEISVYYELEDFYLSPEEVKEIREAANSMQSCNYTNTDYSDMATKIIENSCKAFPAKLTLDKEKSELYIGLMEKNLQKAIDIAFSTPSQVNEDICLLRTLKMVPASLKDGVLAFYDYETNTVYIDYEQHFLNLKEADRGLEL